MSQRKNPVALDQCSSSSSRIRPGPKDTSKHSSRHKASSKGTSPVHIHYHNLNYIQVINKSSPSNKENSDFNNLPKMNQIRLKQKPQPNSRTSQSKESSLVNNRNGHSIKKN